MGTLLTDIKIDPATGRTVIDTDTGDAALISGNDVIAQDAVLRIRTQIGQVKRQGLPDFGWDWMGRLKGDMSQKDIVNMKTTITRTILKDERILDAHIALSQNQYDGEIRFSIKIKVEPGEWLALPLYSIPQG